MKKSSSILKNSITNFDQEDIEYFLKYLSNVEAELGENGRDFTIKFEFADNEYFDACVLTKTYQFENVEDEHPSKLKGA